MDKWVLIAKTNLGKPQGQGCRICSKRCQEILSLVSGTGDEMPLAIVLPPGNMLDRLRWQHLYS